MERIPVIARPRAELDADEFFLYLGQETENPAKANEFLAALGHAYSRLSEHPEIGSPESGVSPRLAGLRKWPVPGFPDRLIYYIPRTDFIDVVRVLGGPEDQNEILGWE